MPENGSLNEATAGTATALSQTAQEYGQKISEVASHAKDFVNDKVSVVGDKIKDLQNADLGELAENAKEYARKKTRTGNSHFGSCRTFARADSSRSKITIQFSN